MNLTYLNKFTNITKSKENKASDASLLRFNLGKFNSLLTHNFLVCRSFSAGRKLFAIRYSLFAIFLTTILPNQLFSQCSPTTSGTTYTATCTWTCPVNVLSVTAECWGGGGGGGGNNSTTEDGGGGGGGGGYSNGTVTVVPGTTYTSNVGEAGTAGTSVADATGNGGAGGNSWFSTTGTIIAYGGGGGARASGGVGGVKGDKSISGVGTTTVTVGGDGADGNNSGLGAGGGGGSSAGTAANGNNGTVGGAGGAAPTGGAAGGNGAYNTAGAPGGAPGGGGSGGGEGTRTGGAGARGQVKITYTACTGPANQATTFTYGSITGTTMTLGWTRGTPSGGARVVVIALAGGAPADPDKAMSFYTANAAYGSGTQVNSSGYVVYDGTGTSVNLTGLSPGTNYQFAAYEYNTAGGTCYNLTQLTGNATTSTPYQATFTAMSVGSTNWCVNETRNVTVTVTNSGTSAWTDAAPDINIVAKMFSGGSNLASANAGGLAAGASATYTLSVTALSTSTNVIFDVEKVSDCLFSANTGNCGPGNSLYTSSAITVSSAPAPPVAITGTNSVTCSGTTQLASTATLPTGGTITTVGGYKIHTFTANGTFTTQTGFTPILDVLVIGGGGGGGNGNVDRTGGGGGAGGYQYNSDFAVSAATGYPVTVGAGGAANAAGSNSVFSTITSIGGGKGGQGASVATVGGSGGGSFHGAATLVAGTAGQGNSGGGGEDGGTTPFSGGGGGGAGAAGGTATNTANGAGGNGLSNSISGSAVTYAGGGGGGSQSTTLAGGAGGTGGGGAGGGNTATAAAGAAGTANLGGGGGGGGGTGTTTTSSGVGGAGGSGIVIIRYPDPSGGTWTSSNTAVATVNSINGLVTGVAGGTTTISYSYTSPGGCASAAVTYTITVPGVPTSVTASASPNPVCTNGTLTLTGGATAGVGAATSWSWAGPNSFSSTSQSPTIASPTVSAAGTYSLTATNACGSAAVQTTASVTVTTLPAATISYAGSPFCISLGAGQAVTRTGTAGGTYSSTAGLTVDGTTGAINPSTSTAGTYTVTYTIAAASGCAQVTATCTVTIYALPAITGQPASPAAINAGAGTAVFTVTATGGGITYQWQRLIPAGSWTDVVNAVTDGGVYSNATTASLSVTNPPFTLNGYKYRCVVSGCTPAATSDGNATLSVLNAGNATPCYNTTQNYNVANVAGVTYTWTFPAGWSVVSGQGSNSVNLLVGVSSGSVTATPSNACGNGPVRSLAVTVASVSIAASATTICSGTSVTFTATPTGGGASPTYQWTKNGTNITGETATTFTSTVLANTDAIAVKMTSTAGCLITSTAINMVVNPASIVPSVSISASATTICSGVSTTFTGVPVNGGSAPVYQWKVNGGNVGTNSTTYTSTTLANTNTVTVVMTNNDACVSPNTATSNAIVMTVNPTLVASSTITASPTGTICGGTSVTFSVSPTNGGTPTYQWKNGAANVGTNSNTYTSTTLANNDAITVLMTTSLNCTTPSPVTSNTITASVNLAITNNTASAAQTICTGSTPAVLTGTTPTGGNGVYTYLWESSTTSSTAGFATASGTSTGSGYTPGALTATTWYRRTVTSAPCASNVSDAIKITVNTAIVNNTVSAAQSICSGTTPNPIAGSVPTGGNGVYTYVWEVSTTSSTAGFGAIGGGVTTQDYSPGALTVNTWYRRTVSSAPCGSSVSDAIKITINPDLAASVSIAASATSICNGTSVVFTPTPTNGGTAPTYQWTKNGSNISGETFNTYTTSTLANSDAIRVVMTSNASPCLTGSPATSAAITMTVNAIPVAVATPSAQTVCSGVAIATMTLTTNPVVASTTFAWTRNNGDAGSGTVTGIAASGTGNISGTLTNTTTSAVTVTFTITPTGPANTNCAGSPITATVLVNPGTPAVPGTISGIANTYAGFTEPYSIAAVSSATSYTWAVPTGWTIASGQGTTAIKATAGTAGQNGNVTVTATNGCGTSAASTYSVTVIANTAAVTTICEGTAQRYTTQYREGVTYTWSVPAGSTITSGAGTNSILVTVGATSGNVTVAVSNSCGNGTDRTLAITASPLPVMTSAISVATCSGVALTHTLTATPASTFSWEAYDRATATGESDSPQTTSTINDVITTTATTIDTVIYSVTPTSTAGCVGGGTAGSLTPQQVTVRINPSNHWSGAAGDRKWRTAGNWCVVPTCTSDAFIPTSPTGGNYPQVEWPDAICQNLTISTGASLELLSNNIALCGNWLNNGTFTPATYKVTFQGTANQTVGGSVASNTFYDLQISNSGASGSDNVTLSKPATVTNVLNLSNGILVTTSTNLLTLTNSANTATNGGGTGTYVNGPMRWNGINGAGPYIFPTGKGSTKWARIGIKDLTAATDFTAEYFNTSYANVGPSFMATTPTPVLTNVSGVEYWNFDRVSGTGNGKVSLYWENATWSGITNCAEDGPLQIAHWDSGISKWENNNNADDIGAGSTCGGATAGYITTTAVVNEFSPFTFGNTDPLVNPLPVELLYFNAAYNGKTVDVTWSTASEINNDYFTVERSIDGVNFITVDVVDSKANGGNSTSILSYSLNDDGVAPGVYYYRLKQTDFNGEFQYSNIDVVEIKGNADFSFNISPNPSDGTELNSIITAEKDQEIVIAVYDVLGQEIYSKIIVTEQKGNTIYAIDLLQQLSSGVYMITATSNQKVYTKRLVVN